MLAPGLIHHCNHCGALWDQDHNDAINLLASGMSPATADQSDRSAIPPTPEDGSETGGKEASTPMV